MQILITAEVDTPCGHRKCALSLLLIQIVELHHQEPLISNLNELEGIDVSGLCKNSYIRIEYTEPEEPKIKHK